METMYAKFAWPASAIVTKHIEKATGRLYGFTHQRNCFSLFGWQFEVHQIATETARLPGADRDTDDHPNTTNDPCLPTQILPKEETDREAGQWRSPDRNDCQA